MGEYLVCPRPACSEVNALVARYCWRCGTRLTEPPPRASKSTARGSNRTTLVFAAEHAGDADGGPD